VLHEKVEAGARVELWQLADSRSGEPLLINFDCGTANELSYSCLVQVAIDGDHDFGLRFEAGEVQFLARCQLMWIDERDRGMPDLNRSLQRRVTYSELKRVASRLHTRVEQEVEELVVACARDNPSILGQQLQLPSRLQRTRADDRRPAALAVVKRKLKQITGRNTTALSLKQVLWKVNSILRGWAAYFRYGASKRTFSYLGHYAWWRMIRWLRRKHLRLGWKQLRRRYFEADAISEGGMTLYNPQAMTVERYRYRGAQIVTPYNLGEVEPTKARFRRTNHDDIGFIGRVSEQLTLHLT
jgi:hypothetical protein